MKVLSVMSQVSRGHPPLPRTVSQTLGWAMWTWMAFLWRIHNYTQICMEYRWQGQWTLWLFCGPQSAFPPWTLCGAQAIWKERHFYHPGEHGLSHGKLGFWEVYLRLHGVHNAHIHTHTHCMHIHACFMQTHEETHATHSKARAESTDEATTCRRGFILPTLRESRERIGSVLILRCQSQYKTDFLLVSRKVRNAGRKVWSNSNLVTVAVAVTS